MLVGDEAGVEIEPGPGFGLANEAACLPVEDGLAEGVGMGVGVAFTCDGVGDATLFEFELPEAELNEFVRLAALLLAPAAVLFELPPGLVGAAIRLFDSLTRLGSVVFGRPVSRVRFEATPRLPPPGTDTTTSSLFARCSTCAVAPGCKRNESTVLSPAR